MQLPFQPSRAWMGWTDSAAGKRDAFYFANLTTYKRILFADDSGRIIDSIPISVAPRWRDALKGLLVYNRDTVAATSEYYNNHVYFFNHAGYIYQDVNLPVTFGDTVYEAMGSGATRTPRADRMIFETCLISTSYLNDTTISDEESGKRGWKLHDYWPLALAYSGVKNGKPAASIVGKAHRKRYTPDGYVSNLSDVSCVSEDAYYYGTASADSVYKFSLADNYTLEKAAPVYSEYGSSKVQPFRTNPMPKGDSYEAYKTKASYRCMKWDPYRKYIYLTMFHYADKDAPPGGAGEHRRWSFFIFDKDLNKLAEILFQPDTYDPNDFIVCPKGLLLRKTDPDNAHKTLFTLFDVVPKN